ncbi:MerR family transcriptional regulator [Janibacter sp. YIM B02568]|uniref:MerR family transcriptional regulator n=1 Tax=Janibacter endophyticus TaxID=2806261 RepID=UPI0019522221|nr:MerR family transcriptional regulator [Janibacter endophyticus]MBM6545837.1 MerR family transcriptional regulator [Janibacter endophyticus]
MQDGSEPAVAGAWRIGDVAERTGLSVRTLRHYDEIGLITPSDRTPGGFRLYTDADLADLLLIRRMKPLGYTLEEMGEVLRVVRAGGTAEALSPLVEEAEARRAQLQAKVEMADEFLDQLRSRHD